MIDIYYNELIQWQNLWYDKICVFSQIIPILPWCEAQQIQTQKMELNEKIN